MLILNTLKVPCFHTLLQVLILKGLAGGLFGPISAFSADRDGGPPRKVIRGADGPLQKAGATKTKKRLARGAAAVSDANFYAS